MLITGATGRIGRAIHALYPEARASDRADGDLARDPPKIRAGEGTVIHLAGNLAENIDAADLNIRMTINVLRACRQSSVRRLIIASSVLADEPRAGFPITYYGAAKAAQEAMLSAWCAEDESRIGVALRFGHFSPGSTPPLEHEAVRLDEGMLAHWVARALALENTGLTTWNAVGRVGK
ncbi:NAD-dependent epimerase/dehydratase family protein [Methylobacterium sp. J-059]|uniref:NAD-dependent epimerase/dehydratase family protein n=1 Tax=Methylobacterium sp. J-059 TaxID=2836643 RepID=UPI001FBAF345|nr:NAD-dependent epimerase/dehydratase family protein [Methylobacterium sp. J-059]MCJ2037591.1 NAD-dependent epimerase/dehydratase family protein [Methylobacterium sp. J-059]